MAMCSPHALVSLPTAASRPALRNSPCFLPTISCSSKRKRKASAKPKVLSPSKPPTKSDLSQNEDFLAGIGGGASTLTALQPLADEEDTLLQRKHKLESQLAQRRLIQKPLSTPSEQQNTDPLSRFILAAYEPSNITNIVPNKSEENLETDGDSNYDTSVMFGDAASEMGADDDVEDNLDDEFEWVEVNAKEADDNNQTHEGNDRFVYWEGDLPPMSKEEESKVLERARRELAILENKRRNSVLRSEHSGDIDDEDEEEEEEGEEDLSLDESEIDDEDEAFLEADAALAQLEATAKKKSVPSDDLNAGPEMSHEAKLHVGPLELGDDDENVGSEKDEADLASRKKLKAGSRKQNKMGDEDDDKEEVEENRQPKKGIPAVMRSFDRAKIYVKAGNGGNGVVAFRREKYVPFGGPSGGTGGRGGHVYVRADPSLNSLLGFRKSVHFRAGRGSHGLGKSQDGAAGVDCIIDVPLGTAIREAGDGVSGPGKVLLEVVRPGQCELLLEGGRGGRGNVAFKTGRNKTPQLAENGEEGAEMWLELELKLVADVGIIGVPNAGKSTLLSVISAAQPAIGAYPFTTLLPNLGVVPIGFEATMVVADLPGLLEGAHLGIGLGHELLRHTERCQVLVHMVDGMSQQPEQEYEAVRLELQLFNPLLSEKLYIVVFNKMDIPEAAERWPCFRDYLRQRKIEPICISAVTKAGVADVVNKAYSLLQSLPSSTYELSAEKESRGSDKLGIAERIRRQRSAPIEEFEIIEDEASRTWQVQGIGLERFVQMTNWEYFEALTRFQHVLTASGVNKALKERGVAEGDIVIVGEMEFVWHDSEDIRAMDWKRGFRGSRLWPH